MAEFGSFVYGADTYAASVVLAVEVLSKNTILVTGVGPGDAFVVNSAYTNLANYSITSLGSGVAVAVKSVIVPPGLTSEDIIIEIDTPTEGELYAVVVSNIDFSDGRVLNSSVEFTPKRTRLDSMVNTLPRHFDKRPESIVWNLLAAIARSDERIGGS